MRFLSKKSNWSSYNRDCDEQVVHMTWLCWNCFVSVLFELSCCHCSPVAVYSHYLSTVFKCCITCIKFKNYERKELNEVGRIFLENKKFWSDLTCREWRFSINMLVIWFVNVDENNLIVFFRLLGLVQSVPTICVCLLSPPSAASVAVLSVAAFCRCLLPLLQQNCCHRASPL